MLIDNFTYCISQLDKCIRAATCKVCVQPHSFVSADSCCGSFGEVKTLFCLETKAYLDEGVFVALQTFRLNLGRKRQKIPPSLFILVTNLREKKTTKKTKNEKT